MRHNITGYRDFDLLQITYQYLAQGSDTNLNHTNVLLAWSKSLKCLFLEPHRAAEREPEGIDTEVIHEIPTEETDSQKPTADIVPSIGWLSNGLDDESMPMFIMTLMFLIIVMRMLAWIFKFSTCFLSCFFFCLWQ